MFKIEFRVECSRWDWIPNPNAEEEILKCVDSGVWLGVVLELKLCVVGETWSLLVKLL